ncbi:MAG: hypothetical protein L3K06_00230 [Thermoplasmata archaeon]|nr:hypothetical protein [Thermoplasmata archaeon]
MTSYSHRDHRVFRAVYRLLAGVGLVTLALIGVSLVAPWPAVGALAVLGLALVGSLAILRSSAIVDGYVDDLHRVGRGDAVAPMLRLEVASRIELERPVFVGARPSPNARRPGAGAAPGRLGPGPSRDPA